MSQGWNVNSPIKQINTYKWAMAFLMNGKLILKKISKLSKHFEAYFQPQNHQQNYSKNKLENITLSIYLRITSTDLHLSFVMHICTAASDTVHYSKIQGSYRPSALPHIQTLNWRRILGDGKTPLWSILYYLILLGKITPHHISIFTASGMTFFFQMERK